MRGSVLDLLYGDNDVISRRFRLTKDLVLVQLDEPLPAMAIPADSLVRRAGLSALCLALAATIGMLSLRNWRGAFDHVSFPLSRERYTVACDSSGFTLVRWPVPNDSQRGAALSFAREMTNDDVIWEINLLFPNDEGLGRAIVCQVDFNSGRNPNVKVQRARKELDRNTLAWGLLHVLDDPQHFVMAHVMLVYQSSGFNMLPCKADGKTIVAEHDGLRARILPPLPKRPRYEYTDDTGRKRGSWAPIQGPCKPEWVVIDPSQMPKLSRQWHDRLCTKLVSIPYAIPLVTVLLYPALFAWRLYCSARLRRRGFCPDCGYDLRSGHLRCPECGSAVSAAA